MKPAIRTFSLQSGSNGNSIYVEAAGVRLLFDAGLSGRQIRERLAARGCDVRMLDGLIVSHEHIDHIYGAGICHRLFHVPLYLTPATLHAGRSVIRKVREVRHFRAGDALHFGPITVYTLPTPHDAVDGVAFVVAAQGRRLGIFTDLGHPFLALTRALEEVDAAYLESNYDPHLLETGPYSPQLKARIRGDGGHLSNTEAADLLRGRGPRWIALAHLSEQNNHPALALETVRQRTGRQFPLHVAGRDGPSEMFEI